jgi:hypothetical protein
MKTCLFPTLIFLTLAPFAARAGEPPPAQVDETTATTAEDLPFGAGYEARERLAQGGQKAAPDQARSQQTEAPQAQERGRSDTRSAATEARAARSETQRASTQRASTQRESRREAREQRGQRGPTRH